jgi:3-dehydroquinate synthase
VKSGAGKDSLLVNLGGGVVSDLGGFAAGTFNRGMPYINIPTSLIAQADAAIGGKTGINISGIKNQAGLFYDPAAVFITPVFLETLPETHFKSGFAEIIKSAALSGDRFWELLKKDGKPDHDHIFRLIFEAVNFKCHVVSEDPFDRNTRKMLNFGHTIGHALESNSILPGGEMLHHGHAVASGMICEAWLSNKIAGLGADEMMELVSVIKSYFDLKPIGENQFDQLAETVNYDKKKAGSGIGFSLLEGLGKHSPGKFVNKSDLFNSFRFYNDIIQKR